MVAEAAIWQFAVRSLARLPEAEAIRPKVDIEDPNDSDANQ